MKRLLEYLQKHKILALAFCLILYFLFMELRYRKNTKEHLEGSLNPTIITAIENLGNIAAQLKKGKLTLPGNLEVAGEIKAKGDIKTDAKIWAENDITTKKTFHSKDAIFEGGVSILGKMDGNQHALWLKSAPLFTQKIYSTEVKTDVMHIGDRCKFTHDTQGNLDYYSDNGRIFSVMKHGNDRLLVYANSDGKRPYFYVSKYGDHGKY